MNNYGLNDEQWAAVVDQSQTMVINASAGSGKTRTLISKIAYLLDNGVSPKSILALTFTNKAAEEMKNRLKVHQDIKDMQVSTIHSMCVRIIRTFIQHTHLKLPFSIYDGNDQLSVIKTIVKSKAISEDPYEIQSAISKAKSDQNEHLLVGDIESVYTQYQEILKANNACDFDDLLILADKCLKQPDCQAYYNKLWQYILVDECQDTSAIQYNIILSIYNKDITKSLTFIGDVNQSIYSWRGANPKNIQHFIDTHKPSERYLTYNYRSGSGIIDHANAFLQYGKEMVAKSPAPGRVSVSVFGSQDDEAETIAQAIMRMQGYEETAILYRMNSRSLGFEKVFAKYHIPYKVVGEKPFFQRKVVRDLMGYLRAGSNPSDIESIARVINNPKRGFGDAKREQLFLRGRPYMEEIAKEMPEIRVFMDILNDIKGKKPAEALYDVINRTGYRKTLTKESDLFMLQAFENIVTGFDTLEELILSSNFLEKDSGHGVKLMTAHASKGLEFDRVFVVGVEEGVWPHAMSDNYDEEARLYYVAVTRGRRFTNISYAQSKIYRNNIMRVEPSPFFKKSSDFLAQGR